MECDRKELVDHSRQMPPEFYRRMSSASSDESGFNSDMSDDVNVQAKYTPPGSLNGHKCCVSSTPTNDHEYVKAVARHLVAYIIAHMTCPTDENHGTRFPPCCSHVATLRRIVDELSSRHEIIFESIARKLRVGVNGHVYPEVCQRTFSGVVDELFSDGQYNWGRVVTVFAFAGWWARSGAPKGGSDAWANAVSDVAGNYTAQKLSTWICNQGGWVTMDKFFATPEPLESKMWRGLVYTMMGLGVVATVAAAVR